MIEFYILGHNSICVMEFIERCFCLFQKMGRQDQTHGRYY